MRRFHLKRGTEYCPTINLEKLWTLVPRQVLEDAKKDTKGKSAPVIDVTQFGFHKVLGTGKLPAAPVVVKAKMFSKLAEIKIGKVGGACQLTC
jgi:large subunit ribosomal protein L27Ae